MPKYEVGQKVMISRINYGDTRYGVSAPDEGRVVKVGRTLVSVEHVDRPKTAPRQYRIDTGVENSGFSSSRIDTEEALAEKERRRSIIERLDKAGVKVVSSLPSWSTSELRNETLSGILELVLADRRSNPSGN